LAHNLVQAALAAVIMRALKLREIGSRLECHLDGDGDVEIVRVAGIQHAQPGDLTFVANVKYLPQLASTRASAVILGGNRMPRATPGAAPQCGEPDSGVARAVAILAPSAPPPRGIA